MELSQAKSFGPINDHHRRIRYIDTDFDDTRRYEKLYFPFLEVFHNRFFFFPSHAPMNEAAMPLFKDFIPQFIIKSRRRLEVAVF